MALSVNWLTEHLIDVEYKRYQLLAYLQEVSRNYAQNRIYPWLAEVISHYRNLMQFKEDAQVIRKKERTSLSGIDWENLKLKYSVVEKENEVLEELNQIVAFAAPMLKSSIQDGQRIFSWIEKNLNITSVGITPIKKDEGYLLLQCGNQPEIHIYQYQLSIFSAAEEKYRSLSTTYCGQRELNFYYTVEKIKSDLIAEKKDLPNPAVYAFAASMHIPVKETLLPVVKRVFVSKISI